MATYDWQAWAHQQCVEVADAGRWRAPRPFDAAGPVGTLGAARSGGPGPPIAAPEAATGAAGVPAAADGLVSFASNDYLGLTQHPAVVAAAHRALDRWGAGSGAARLVVGSRPVHHELEAALRAWKATDDAVLFPTGYAANLGVLTTVAGPGVRVLSDELNHASIIDGCRLARASVEIVRHRDLDHLSELLDAADGPTVVVTDTVFSMDGDVADVAALLEMCAAAGALVVLDEAHAVLGPEPVDHRAVLLRVGTLSKTLGTLGGFVAGPRELCRLIENRARSYIFTTAPTPADTAGALEALRILRSPEGDALRDRLRGHIDRVAPGHPSPVVPVVIGDEADAVAAAAALVERGLLVPAIRPPTVAPGTSRLRVALSAAHTDEQVEGLVEALDELGLTRPGASADRSAPHRAAAPSTVPASTVAPSIDPASSDVAVRPALVVVVMGTATEVGKTWATAAVARSLTADGLVVSARKPVQSFAPGDDTTDAEVLAAATGEPPDDVCPRHRRYEVPMAPPMAADALGRPGIALADLIAELCWTVGADVGFVETAGGVRSPLAHDADAADLAMALGADAVVLVADAGLGTVHAVRSAIQGLGSRPLLVLLNRFDGSDDLHRRNRDWLAGIDGLDVVTDVAELATRLTALVSTPARAGGHRRAKLR
jgi:8-amino-7-oxononanoate synthase